jgi:hypothetical protein|tara:strand:- start:4490 stop:4753 length:264 start_codon:yes stop_codon:yes gene_type:complete
MKEYIDIIREAEEDEQMKDDMLEFIMRKLDVLEREIRQAPSNSAEDQKDKKFLVDMFRFFRQKMKQQREKNPPEDKLDTDIPSDIPS